VGGFDPPELDRPGRLPHQQGLCEARLGYRDGSPQLGAPQLDAAALQDSGGRKVQLLRLQQEQTSVFFIFFPADFSEFRTSRVIAASRGRCVDAWDAVACRVSSKVEGALVLWHYPPPFAFMFCPQADMLA
jgi:hypothetical protein